MSICVDGVPKHLPPAVQHQRVAGGPAKSRSNVALLEPLTLRTALAAVQCVCLLR